MLFCYLFLFFPLRHIVLKGELLPLMELELMVTKCDDKRQQGEYRAICLWKIDWESFAEFCNNLPGILAGDSKCAALEFSHCHSLP